MPRTKANRTFCKSRRDRFGRRRKFLSISPNTQSWIDSLGLNAKLSEMAQSVHNKVLTMLAAYMINERMSYEYRIAY